MSDAERQWFEVDGYFTEQLRPADRVLTKAIRDGSALPQIQVSDLLAGFLSVLARSAGANRILEIGTLFGYSTIHLARALTPGGSLISLEFSPEHAQVARGNIERAGLDDRVQVIEGAAMDTLPTLADSGPFDLVFIDADKENNPGYLHWALELTRPGSVIVVDNVVHGGDIVEPSSEAPAVLGTQSMVDSIGTAVRAGRLDATALQTVGSKGYDGVLVAYVL